MQLLQFLNIIQRTSHAIEMSEFSHYSITVTCGHKTVDYTPPPPPSIAAAPT